MPQLGESIAEATVVSLKVQPGDKVVADQEVIEVETNKAVMGVTTPCAGEIASITAQPKETYPVGAVLGYIEASEVDAAKFVKTTPEPPKEKMAAEIPGRRYSRGCVQAGPGGVRSTSFGGSVRGSPASRAHPSASALACAAS